MCVCVCVGATVRKLYDSLAASQVYRPCEQAIDLRNSNELSFLNVVDVCCPWLCVPNNIAYTCTPHYRAIHVGVGKKIATPGFCCNPYFCRYATEV